MKNVVSSKRMLLFFVSLIAIACETTTKTDALKDETVVTKINPSEIQSLKWKAITPKKKVDESKLKKVIYLTFDDGPSPNITPKILDTLKHYDIKATFFVIGNSVKQYPKVLKRIYDEGHSIGNHTQTHDFKKIYASVENLKIDVQTADDLLFEIIGERPRLFRAPGGSKPFLTDEMRDSLHTWGYKIHDWNAMSGDASKKRPDTQTLYENVIRTARQHQKLCILMHDWKPHENTVVALSMVIQNYKKQGFEFLPITDNTQEMRME